MEKDLVSVIIPMYNRQNTIKDAINSVLNQSYKNIELILVDDCSKDKTVEVAKSINDNRIKIIQHIKNKGACAARNTGISQASGEYIAFNDSDDIWRVDKIKKQLNMLKLNKASVVFCQMERHNYKHGENIFPLLDNGIVSYEKLLIKSKCSTQTILAKKEVFDQFIFDENLPRFQDYDFVIRSACKFKYCFLKECLVDVYLQPDSITSLNHKKLLEINLILYEKHKNLFKEYPEFELFLLDSIGYFQVEYNENAFLTYKRMFEIKKNKKNFTKMMLAKFKLLKYIWFK